MGESASQPAIPRGPDFRFDPIPKLVIFDLDNTLADHHTSLQIRLHHAFEPFFPDPVDRERVVNHSTEIATDGTRHFPDLLSEHGVDAPADHQLVRERYVSDRYRGLQLYSDTLPVITAIKQVTEVAIITNGPTDIQQPKLDLLEIEHHFSFVLISEKVGIWKPDPGIFNMALEIGKVSASEAIYVGDSVEADVPGAQAANMTAVWINRQAIEWPGGPPPDLEVRDLVEFVTTLGLELTR